MVLLTDQIPPSRLSTKNPLPTQQNVSSRSHRRATRLYCRLRGGALRAQVLYQPRKSRRRNVFASLDLLFVLCKFLLKVNCLVTSWSPEVVARNGASRRFNHRPYRAPWPLERNSTTTKSRSIMEESLLTQKLHTLDTNPRPRPCAGIQREEKE